MNKITLLCLLVSISCVTVSAQKVLTRRQAQVDISFFFDQAEQIHPDLYRHISKGEMRKRIEEVIEELPNRISDGDLSVRLRLLVNSIEDGHTNVSVASSLSDQFRSGNTMLPFTISYSKGGIKIRSSDVVQLHPGDRLLALNRISVSDFAQLMGFPYVDIPSQRAARTAENFSYYFFLKYRIQDSINVRVLRGDKVVQIVVPMSRYMKKTAIRKYHYHVEENGVGVLSLDAFWGIEEKKYRRFLDSVFTSIQRHPIKRLLVDVSRNGGGNSYYGAILLPYLNVTNYRFNQKYLIKTSGPEKKYIRKHFIKWYMYPLAVFSKIGRILLFKPNGAITDLHPKDEKLPSSALAYKGPVYVLTSNATYSAAADFVSAFQYAQRGLLVGEATGQPYSGFIDKIPFVLPNSKLHAGVSFKAYEYIGCNASNRYNGILPDLPVDLQNFPSRKGWYKAVLSRIQE